MAKEREGNSDTRRCCTRLRERPRTLQTGSTNKTKQTKKTNKKAGKLPDLYSFTEESFTNMRDRPHFPLKLRDHSNKAALV